MLAAKLFVFVPLLALQATGISARATSDQDHGDLVSFGNILARLEENSVPTTLFTLSNKLRDGIFAQDSNPKAKRQGNNLTPPSNSPPSAVPTITVPTVNPTSNPEPTNNPSPTETETETETETDTETDTPTQPTEAPTETTPDQPASTTSKNTDDSTTSKFQTQTRPSSSSSSSSSSKDEATTEPDRTTRDTEPTQGVSRSTSLSTKTLPDGSKSTITSVVVVNPTAEVTEGGDSPTETRGEPGLQTGAAGTMISNNEILALLGGAAAFALAL